MTTTEFGHHRSRLISIAYHMLGSLADAEDMVQEAFVRWQQASLTEVFSPRAYLTAVVTRLCIDHLRSAHTRREEVSGLVFPEPMNAAPLEDPTDSRDLADSLSVAFLRLLTRLPSIERAVFLLREAFEYEYEEIAAVVGKSGANCRQILRRARQHLAARRPRFEAPYEVRKHLVEEFVIAAQTGDVEHLLGLLSPDLALYASCGATRLSFCYPHGNFSKSGGGLRPIEL